MITTIIFDFSRVLILFNDREYTGGLNKKLKSIQQTKTRVDVLDYYSLNTELLEYAKSIKNDYNLFIFTSGRLHESDEIFKQIKPVFQKVYNSLDLNLSKEDFNSYITISNMIGEKPENMIFIDDGIKRVNAAQKAGLHTVHYQDNQSTIDQINEIIASSGNEK